MDGRNLTVVLHQDMDIWANGWAGVVLPCNDVRAIDGLRALPPHPYFVSVCFLGGFGLG